MVSFKYFTSIVTMRIPLSDDGKVGIPEILKKTTFETKDPRKKTTKKENVDITLEESEEMTL